MIRTSPATQSDGLRLKRATKDRCSACRAQRRAMSTATIGPFASLAGAWGVRIVRRWLSATSTLFLWTSAAPRHALLPLCLSNASILAHFRDGDAYHVLHSREVDEDVFNICARRIGYTGQRISTSSGVTSPISSSFTYGAQAKDLAACSLAA
jgi:hypothetical protein